MTVWKNTNKNSKIKEIFSNALTAQSTQNSKIYIWLFILLGIYTFGLATKFPQKQERKKKSTAFPYFMNKDKQETHIYI